MARLDGLIDAERLLDMKFILLHEGKNDEGIRLFFQEVWELYLKVSGVQWPVASHGLVFRRC